jgi:hypothetical protein
VRCENQRDRPDWDIIATSAMWPCPSQVCGSADKCPPTHRALGTESVDVNFCMFHLGSSRCRRWRLFSNGHLLVVGLLSRKSGSPRLSSRLFGEAWLRRATSWAEREHRISVVALFDHVVCRDFCQNTTTEVEDAI